MGRRCESAEGTRSRLGKDDPGNLSQFAPDFLNQCSARGLVRFAVLLPLIEKRFNARDSSPDQSRRAAVKPSLLGFACLRPCRSDVVVEVGLGAVSESAVDQPQRMTDARQAGHRFGMSDRHLRLGLGDEVKHPSGLRGRN